MGVEAIGGLFFRAADPDALSAWYREILGVGGGCAAEEVNGEAEDWCWRTAGGPVVFAPFSQDSDYFPANRQFMLNLRVTGMNELLSRLRQAGVEVETRSEWDTPETGKFARIHDPEGNPIELWQMPGSSG
jgi:predicted enzyme related to lactoylglutathione lyase